MLSFPLDVGRQNSHLKVFCIIYRVNFVTDKAEFLAFKGVCFKLEQFSSNYDLLKIKISAQHIELEIHMSDYYNYSKFYICLLLIKIPISLYSYF